MSLDSLLNAQKDAAAATEAAKTTLATSIQEAGTIDKEKLENLSAQAGQAQADLAAATQAAQPTSNVSTGVLSSISGQEGMEATLDSILRAGARSFDLVDTKPQHGIVPTLMPSNLPHGYYTVHLGWVPGKDGAKQIAAQIGGRYFFAEDELSEEGKEILEGLVKDGRAEHVTSVSAE